MHPHTFIERLWRGEERDEVFVAMCFDPRYETRYREIFRPAIKATKYKGKALSANRVDESQAGDSILTEIVRGICEARLVLADVSDLSNGSADSDPVRNGNVMYELGIAHAVKSPSKVVIVRDDSKPILFDVSSIPHFSVDFTSIDTARETIARLLTDRLREAETIEDFKLSAFIDSISDAELSVLLRLYNDGVSAPIDLRIDTSTGKVLPLTVRDAFLSLRDAGLVRSHIISKPVAVLYSLTERGQRACRTLGRALRDSNPKPNKSLPATAVEPSPGE
jgi:DNA-binding HxlR family transcriptional regulator